MLGGDDLGRLRAWTGAAAAREPRKAEEAEAAGEGIFLDGTLHRRNWSVARVTAYAGAGASEREKRAAVAEHYAARAVADGEAVLVSVGDREDVPWLARHLAQRVGALYAKRRLHGEAAGRIRGIEPGLPGFGIAIAFMLERGVAYHHAGLPRRYRRIVEDAARGGRRTWW